LDKQISKYNELISRLNEVDPPLTPLDKKRVDSMLLTDEFWELDRFHSRERWAMDRNVRTAIMQRQLHNRALEEIQILSHELLIYVKWASSRLDNVISTIKLIKVRSPLALRILHAGHKCANALSNITKSSFDKLKVPRNEAIQTMLQGITDC
jgi:hypothetical protein